MKKLLLLVSLLFTTIMQSQVTLPQVMDSIYKKGDAREFDLRPLVDKYVGEILIVDSLPPSKFNTKVLGKAVTNTATGKVDVFVIREMFNDFFNAERVVIHEIGHALYLKHCCEDEYCVQIMTPQQAIEPDHILYQIAFLTTEYEKTFDIFFNQLKEKSHLY